MASRNVHTPPTLFLLTPYVYFQKKCYLFSLVFFVKITGIFLASLKINSSWKKHFFTVITVFFVSLRWAGSNFPLAPLFMLHSAYDLTYWILSKMGHFRPAASLINANFIDCISLFVILADRYTSATRSRNYYQFRGLYIHS